tara:strand:+ start:113 stop:640 length:528 start_codon:yes stop_codon:yes gene_type:complete
VKRILFILTVSLFTFSSNAEEIGLFCKTKITLDEIPSLARAGIKEVYYEKLLYFDKRQKTLHYLSVKENLILEDGTKKKGENIIYSNISQENSIPFWKNLNQNIYKFGYAIVDENFYNLKTYVEMIDQGQINLSARRRSYQYVIYLEDLILKEFSADTQLEESIPAIVYNCKKMN